MVKRFKLKEVATWKKAPCHIYKLDAAIERFGENYEVSLKELLSVEKLSVSDMLYMDRYIPGWLEGDFKHPCIEIFECVSRFVPHPILEELVSNLKTDKDSEYLVESLNSLSSLLGMMKEVKIITCAYFLIEGSFSYQLMAEISSIGVSLSKEKEQEKQKHKDILLRYL